METSCCNPRRSDKKGDTRSPSEAPLMTAAEILGQLDQAAGRCNWPILENVNVDMASVRLHAYGDGARWALVMEVLGTNIGAGPSSIHTTLYCYGNCLKTRETLSLVLSADVGPALDKHTGELRSDGYILVRGRRVAVDLSPATLERLEIRPRLAEPGDFELLLTLLSEHREALLATREELAEIVPADLSELLLLDEWNHPRVNERPSDTETFRLLAQVLATGQAEHWRPLTAPNTDWPNWIEGK